jgi:chemotaxis methyl-accepting protein methylase
MGEPLTLSGKLRHVVFPRAGGRARTPPVNADPGPPAPASDAGLPGENAVFLHWLLARAGLDARGYRPATLQRRLPACLRALRARSPAEARRGLDQRPELLGPALDALLIGVTGFFRDALVFDHIRRHLRATCGPARRGPQVWSAACSDGSELVSLALMLAEEGLLARSYLLGTDCRPDAVRRARAGWYDEAALRTLADGLRDRYFQPQNGGRLLVPAVRGVLRWRVADVLAAPEPGVWDLILFRNAAMYFRPEAARGLWARFETALRPGALLVLGKAERPVGVRRLEPVGPCVFRRVAG